MPILDKKPDKVPGAQPLSAATPETAPWLREVQVLALRGMPSVDEWVFFHPSSRTLVVTDGCFNLHEPMNVATRLYAKLEAVHDRFASPILLRLALRDKAALRESIVQISGWDFERVIMAHGEPIQGDGKVKFRAAWQWLLNA
jgi:hypothetical protein